MKNRQYILFFFAIVLLISCSSQRKIATNNSCSTKYPILLVHGVGFRDDFPVIRYWSKLPEVLERSGAKVYLSNQDAYNSHVENAIQLRDRVLDILAETGAEKINIIAHSKGGLESRYMITRLDMAGKVASLTTLATPHRGSFLADTILNWLTKKGWLDNVAKVAGIYAHLLGDEKPDVLNAARNLTLEYMDDFNCSVPDMPQVYYQSFGGIVTKEYPAWHIRFQEKIIGRVEGENDCTVSKRSYQWGNFRWVVSGDQDFGVSHFDIVGMKFVSKQSSFDAENFLVEVVMDLKHKGF